MTECPNDTVPFSSTLPEANCMLRKQYRKQRRKNEARKQDKTLSLKP